MISYRELHEELVRDYGFSRNESEHLPEMTSLIINISMFHSDVSPPDSRMIDLEIIRDMANNRRFHKMIINIDMETLIPLAQNSKIRYDKSQTTYERDTTPQLLQLVLEQTSPKKMSNILLQYTELHHAFQLLIANLSCMPELPSVSIDKFWPCISNGPVPLSSQISPLSWIVSDTVPHVSLCLQVYGERVKIQLNVGLPSRDSLEYAANMRIKALATLSCICAESTYNNSHYIPWNVASRSTSIRNIGIIGQPLEPQDICHALSDHKTDDILMTHFIMNVMQNSLEELWLSIRKDDVNTKNAINIAARFIREKCQSLLAVILHKKVLALSLTNILDVFNSIDLLEMLCRRPCQISGQPTPFWKGQYYTNTDIIGTDIHPELSQFMSKNYAYAFLE